MIVDHLSRKYCDIFYYVHFTISGQVATLSSVSIKVTNHVYQPYVSYDWFSSLLRLQNSTYRILHVDGTVTSVTYRVAHETH